MDWIGFLSFVLFLACVFSTGICVGAGQYSTAICIGVMSVVAYQIGAAHYNKKDTIKGK